MKKNGFTLVELLGVILLLGLLAAIVYPTVSGIIRGSKKQANESQKKIIISSAEMWASENSNLLSEIEGSIYKLPIEQLKQGGYLNNTSIKDLEKNIDLTNACVKITTTSNKYTYEFKDVCE